MSQTNQSHTKFKKILLISVAVVIFLVSSFVVIILLKDYLSKGATAFKTTSTTTPADIITAYTAPNAIAGLSAKLYHTQPVDSATIQDQLAGKSYGVSVTTTHSALFFALNKDQSDNTAAIQGQTIAFMTQKGLAKAPHSPAAANGLTYTNFANQATMCQLTDSNPPSGSVLLRYHQIACVDANIISNEYTAIDPLLALYKQSLPLGNITQVAREVASEKNVSYATLAITTDRSHLLLLFGAVNNNWDYIGDLTANSGQASGSRYNITPSVLAKMSNPKYNGFIIRSVH